MVFFMQLATVVGMVWSTRKEERLLGMKLLIVKPLDPLNDNNSIMPLIAIDSIGAGIGETVLIVCGSAARIAANNPDAPVDCAVVGIVDDKEVAKD